jgi:acylphosphatase
MSVSKQLRIHGRVQGVGYRYALCGEARARGLAGWVRNRRDGTVEALLQGEPVAVEAVIVWSRRGPPAARVDRVEVEDLPPAGGPVGGFEQLPTL